MTRRSTRRALIIAVAVLVVAGIALGAYLLGRSTTGTPPTASPTPTGTAAASASPSASYEPTDENGSPEPGLPRGQADRRCRRHHDRPCWSAARLQPRPDRRRQRRHQLPHVDELPQDHRQEARRPDGRRNRRRRRDPTGPHRVLRRTALRHDGVDCRPAGARPRGVRRRRLHRRPGADLRLVARSDHRHRRADRARLGNRRGGCRLGGRRLEARRRTGCDGRCAPQSIRPIQLAIRARRRSTQSCLGPLRIRARSPTRRTNPGSSTPMLRTNWTRSPHARSPWRRSRSSRHRQSRSRKPSRPRRSVGRWRKRWPRRPARRSRPSPELPPIDRPRRALPHGHRREHRS